jgi:hypothetical protein
MLSAYFSSRLKSRDDPSWPAWSRPSSWRAPWPGMAAWMMSSSLFHRNLADPGGGHCGLRQEPRGAHDGVLPMALAAISGCGLVAGETYRTWKRFFHDEPPLLEKLGINTRHLVEDALHPPAALCSASPSLHADAGRHISSG